MNSSAARVGPSAGHLDIFSLLAYLDATRVVMLLREHLSRRRERRKSLNHFETGLHGPFSRFGTGAHRATAAIHQFLTATPWLLMAPTHAR